MKKPQKVAYLNLLAGFYGYAERKHLYKANNRVKSFECVINGKHRSLHNLLDKMEYQRVPIDYKKEVHTIQIIIKDVFKGTKYDDTCISSILVATPLAKEPKNYGAR